MAYKIKEVKPFENSVVLAIFEDGVEKEYDMKQLFNRFPRFKAFESEKGLFEMGMKLKIEFVSKS